MLEAANKQLVEKYAKLEREMREKTQQQETIKTEQIFNSTLEQVME
jgi:hypothetical protein